MTISFLFSGIIISMIVVLLTTTSIRQHKYFRFGVIGYFTALLFMFGEHWLEYSGYSCDLPHTIFISAVFYLLLAPFLNAIIQSLFNAHFITKSFLIELIPAFSYLILMIPFYALDGETKCNYLTNYIDINQVSSYKHALLVWITFLQTSIYAYFWYRRIRSYSSTVKSTASSGDIEFLPWISRSLSTIVLFTFCMLATWIARSLSPDHYYILDQAENVVLSFIPIVFLFLLFFLPEKPFPSLEENSTFEGEVMEFDPTVRKQLEKLMQREKLYLHPDLNLGDLAKRMHLTRHGLSELLSRGFQKNFYDFVNEYRIVHARELMDSEMIKTFSLSGIARESGFNSYVSFYRVFKRIMQQTPSAYLNK
ncbi:MAG: helix-turn-helix domain-containing protein [Cyclobacteriaceae bacterium]